MPLGNLFAGKIRTTKKPFEDKKREDRAARQTDRSQSAVDASRSAQQIDRGQLAGLSGLANAELSALLEQAVLDSGDNQIYTDILNRRAGQSTPAGYASARNDVISDFSRAVAEAGHVGSATGRFDSDYTDRQSNQSQRILSRSLLDAFDRSANESDALTANLVQGAGDAGLSRARGLANILSSGAFERFQTQDTTGTSSRQEDEARFITELAKRLSSSSLDSFREGFTTQVTQDPSIAQGLGQIGSFISGVGGGIGGFESAKGSASGLFSLFTKKPS